MGKWNFLASRLSSVWIRTNIYNANLSGLNNNHLVQISLTIYHKWFFCKIKFKKKHCIVEGVQLPHKGMLFYSRISLFFNRKILFVYCRSLLSSLISSANHGWVLVSISWTILNMVAWLLSAWVSPRAVLPMGLMLDGCSKYIAHLLWTML